MQRFVFLLLTVFAVAAVSPFVCAQADHAAERVFYNAKVFTAEPAHPYAEAVAIRGDKIVAVGTRAEAMAAVGKDAEMTDLQGKTLLPGLIDSHTHVLSSGLDMATDAPESVHTTDALAAFTQDARTKGRGMRGDIQVVSGLELYFWQKLDELNAHFNSGVFADHPLLLEGSDGHTGWANRVLLKRAGVTPEFLRGLAPKDRRYYGANANFEPNGFIVDDGFDKVDVLLPEPTVEQYVAAGRGAFHNNFSLGITAWLEPSDAYLTMSSHHAGMLEGYKIMAERGELTAHVAAFPAIDPKVGKDQLPDVQKLREEFKGIPNLTIPGIKIFEDGVVEVPSHTAALTRPYSDGSNGELLFSPARLAEIATEADKEGLIVHVHAIGDLAVRTALDAFAAARKANGNSGLPDTITHLQFVQPEDFSRFRELGVIASMQLLWAEAGADTIEAVKPHIAPEIFKWQYPARSLLDNGATIAGASDWSVSSANVFYAIYQAETRKGSEGVLDPSQRMPREAMLYAYTRNAARALNQQEHIGSLAPGKQADLVLVDRDVLTVPAEEMKETKVLWTMFGGKVIYRSSE